MNNGKTQSHWCPKLYTSPGVYSRHVKKVYPDKNLKSTGKQKWWICDISNLSTYGSELYLDLDKPVSPGWWRFDQSISVTLQPQLDLKTVHPIVSQDYGSSDIEYGSEGSDREARGFTSNPEPDSKG